jgi:uncharacterized membrane protein
MSKFLNTFCPYGFALAAFSISPVIFWPYFFGGAILIIGLAMGAKNGFRQARGEEKLIWFGPLLFAIPMAIFGGDHMVTAKFIVRIIPAWIPGHLFWAYFVGVALIAAGLSLATKIQWRLASLLLGIMIFLFVVLLHIPALFTFPHARTQLTIIALRDLALSGGALAAGTSRTHRHPVEGRAGRLHDWRLQILNPMLSAVTRFMVAIPVAFFGIDQILNPTAAPGIPQDSNTLVLTMPAWIPGHVFWAYLSGTIFVACALGLLSRKYARSAAIFLGATVLVVALFVYVPLTVAKASDVDNGLNYLAIHLALAGVALLLAGSLPVLVPRTVHNGKLGAENVGISPEAADCNVSMTAPRKF